MSGSLRVSDSVGFKERNDRIVFLNEAGNERVCVSEGGSHTESEGEGERKQ